MASDITLPSPTRSISESSSDSLLNENITTLDSLSLNEELQILRKMLSVPKECQTEKRTSGRPKKNGLQSQVSIDYIPKIIEYLDTIYDLNVKIVAQVDIIWKENRDLKKIVEASANKSSYASIVSSGSSSAASESHLRRAP